MLGGAAPTDSQNEFATAAPEAAWQYVARVWTPPVPHVIEHAPHALKPYEYTAHGPCMQFCCDGGVVPGSSPSQKALATGTSGTVLSAQKTRRVCTPVPHETEHVDQACDENVYLLTLQGACWQPCQRPHASITARHGGKWHAPQAEGAHGIGMLAKGT